MFLNGVQRMEKVDFVVNFIIKQYFQNQDRKKCMSNKQLPCTCCLTYISSAWRPGPAGPGSLCNVCGIKYTNRKERPRMIELVLIEEKAMWMQRHKLSLQWEELCEADNTDSRIISWKKNENDKINYINCKKRKILLF